MNRIVDVGTAEERFAKITQSINFSPNVVLGSAYAGPDLTITTAPTGLGGIIVDRAWLKTRFLDGQWVVRAALRLIPGDANGMLVELIYNKDDGTAVVLGSTTPTGAAFTKIGLGPFDVFATGGVPTTESFPALRLRVTKVTSGTGTVSYASMWLELRTVP
jgi:hypothetical protein